MPNVYTDINVRLSDIDPTDTMVVYDSNAVKQALIHLIESEEQEVQYFRAWGLNLKQYLQSPLNENTARDAYDHIKGKIERFFSDSVRILEDQSSLTLNYKKENIEIILTFELLETGEVFNIPTITVITNTL